MSLVRSVVSGTVGRGAPHGRLGRWAVGLAAAFGTMFTAGVAAIAIAYAAGVSSAVEDTLLGGVLFALAAAGLVGAFAGFVAAIVARVGHERRTLLWLPLSTFPAIVLIVVLGEALWWE